MFIIKVYPWLNDKWRYIDGTKTKGDTSRC